ncbi:MAG: hypothetical protein ABFC34_03310 [Methanobacterium sp.]
MDNEEFRSKLKEVCMKYDIEKGRYPESDFEGRSIYESYCVENKLEVDTDTWETERDKRFYENYEVIDGTWKKKKL